VAKHALPALIVGAAIVLVLATTPAEADRVDAQAGCAVPFRRVALPPAGRMPSVVLSVDPVRALVSGREVRWRLTVRNLAGRTVGLVFRSAQYGDVTLSAPGRGTVYRWSDGRAFAQPILPTVLAPRSTTRCSLDRSTLDVPPGRYLLGAHLNAYEPTRPLRRISFRRYVVVAPPG
jgi:Intracellular proteinase inhibitor